MNRKHNSSLTALAKTLRKNMTKEERRLWYDFLRHYPVRFLRQKVVDNYIVDFYCHDAQLIIELDGSQHYTNHGWEKDSVRTSHLEQRNFLVLHIPNNALSHDFQSVCEYIDHIVTERLTERNGPLA